MVLVLVRISLQFFFIHRMLWLTSCSAMCSCYTFHDVLKTWQTSNNDCKTRNGALVSMETQDEWKFIKNEIQERNTSSDKLSDGKYRNEWFIGLNISWKDFSKNTTLEGRRRANWLWTSGKPLSYYNKWQPLEPNSKGKYDWYCGVMAKNFPEHYYGLFKDVQCGITFPYICEYNQGVVVDTSLNPVCWDQSLNTSVASCTQAITSTTGMTFSETTKPVEVITDRPLSPTTNQTTTTTTAKTIIIKKTSQTSSATIETTAKASTEALQAAQPLPYVFIIVIVLVVILVLLICLFIAVCCWIRKKKGKPSTDKRSSQSSKQTKTNSLQYTSTINDLNGSPNGLQIAGPETVIYAQVNDKTAPHPTPTYADVQEYLVPMDSPTSPPPTDLYSNIVETNRQQQGIDGQGIPTDENRMVETNTYEPVNNDAPAAAVYEVIDNSKKSKEKAGVTLATEGEKVQNKAKFNGESADQSSEVAPMYAVVDKSKKTKREKARVSIANEGGNRFNDPNQVLANQNPSTASELYAVVDKSKQGKKARVSIATEDGRAGDGDNNDKLSSETTVYAEVDKTKKKKNTNEQRELEMMYAQVDKSQKTKNKNINAEADDVF